ncbi:SDR family NAD(P)-dependent oxidoreductase [Flavobacterium silvaticum]|uniref:SDR family oxidoreductase n=1 Tax=Flavobacterium silvaticum TaxID=1852020 RepID=A0A972FTZ3_9FLAO|nr:SDR family oxidoreductase [Flavobacterium silvaticum]NMH27545.1 SDR family oxidoreductase [Flavobacterium silvaticum]
MSNKIALVTGGSRGLGKNMALQLAAKGLDVVITYNSRKDEAEEVVKAIQSVGQKAAAIQLDASKSGVYDDFYNRLKPVLKETFGTSTFDYLVNNAGFGIHKSIEETTEEDFVQLTHIHLMAPFFLSQKALPLLNDNGGIVNISSGLARFSFPGYAAYGALKGGVETLTRYLAKEFGGRGIRANVVAPGAIETDFGGAAVRNNPELKQQLASLTALGRVGQADDLGGVVAFLCSDDSKWVNGQRIEVAGGIFL